MPKYNVHAWFYETVRFDANFPIEVSNVEVAKKLVKKMLDESGGNDSDPITWDESFTGGDGDFEFELEETDATESEATPL